MPLAHLRPGLRVTVYSVGEVNSADSAMSGTTSGAVVVGVDQEREHLVLTANEPLSYEPAGSRVVTLSVVPTMSGSPEAASSVAGASAATGATGEKEGRGAEGADGEAETAAPAVVQ